MRLGATIEDCLWSKDPVDYVCQTGSNRMVQKRSTPWLRYVLSEGLVTSVGASLGKIHGRPQSPWRLLRYWSRTLRAKCLSPRPVRSISGRACRQASFVRGLISSSRTLRALVRASGFWIRTRAAVMTNRRRRLIAGCPFFGTPRRVRLVHRRRWNNFLDSIRPGVFSHPATCGRTLACREHCRAR